MVLNKDLGTIVLYVYSFISSVPASQVYSLLRRTKILLMVQKLLCKIK